ncbi:MAG: GNAT family N-acetyltransferase [Sphingobium sp.]|nr:GNAT family N-acetyltransferase [Sphingobium sp.]
MLAGDRIAHPVKPGAPGFDDLLSLSLAEGHDMLRKLVDEWASATNRFDSTGECYLGASVDGVLLAVGGLNRDNYDGGTGLARLRHFYVHPDFRREGLGYGLLNILIFSARLHFPAIRLRTGNPVAASFYEAQGFDRTDEPFATHRLKL